MPGLQDKRSIATIQQGELSVAIEGVRGGIEGGNVWITER